MCKFIFDEFYEKFKHGIKFSRTIARRTQTCIPFSFHRCIYNYSEQVIVQRLEPMRKRTHKYGGAWWCVQSMQWRNSNTLNI